MGIPAANMTVPHITTSYLRPVMAQREYRKAGVEMLMAPISLLLLKLLFLLIRRPSSETEENRYGRRQLRVDSIIINVNIFTSPLV